MLRSFVLKPASAASSGDLFLGAQAACMRQASRLELLATSRFIAAPPASANAYATAAAIANADADADPKPTDVNVIITL